MRTVTIEVDDERTVLVVSEIESVSYRRHTDGKHVVTVVTRSGTSYSFVYTGKEEAVVKAVEIEVAIKS